MTLPCERTRAVIRAHDFLVRLSHPNWTKRVPKDVRDEAKRILRHYPWPVDLCRDGQFDQQVVDEYYDRRRNDD